MLNVLPCWAGSRIQIKSINKDTFCFHLKLSPPAGPQGGEVTAALITGRSLGLGEARLSGACWPSVERGVRGPGVSKQAWCKLGSCRRAGAEGAAAGWGNWFWSACPVGKPQGPHTAPGGQAPVSHTPFRQIVLWAQQGQKGARLLQAPCTCAPTQSLATRASKEQV